MVANSFRNSSSKNCFPSILLQFHFIYYPAASRWSHFSLELLERDAAIVQEARGLIYGPCATGARPGAPARGCGWQNAMPSGPARRGLPFGDGCHKC